MKLLLTCDTELQQKGFLREVTIPPSLSFPGVVRMRNFGFPHEARIERGVEVAPASSGFIVTDFLPCGTLKGATAARVAGRPLRGWGPTQWTKALFGIAAIMARVHSRRVIHRDLKPDNILLDANLEPWIADFGLARIASHEQRTQGIGSPLCMAPELLSDAYSYGVDVYAYGVTVFATFSTSDELVSGRARDVNQFLRRVMAGDRLKRPARGTPAEIPDPVWALIENCWQHAPADRPTFGEIAQRFVDNRALWIPGTDPAQFEAYRRIVYPAPVPPPPDYWEEGEAEPEPAPPPPAQPPVVRGRGGRAPGGAFAFGRR